MGDLVEVEGQNPMNEQELRVNAADGSVDQSRSLLSRWTSPERLKRSESAGDVIIKAGQLAQRSRRNLPMASINVFTNHPSIKGNLRKSLTDLKYVPYSSRKTVRSMNLKDIVEPLE